MMASKTGMKKQLLRRKQERVIPVHKQELSQEHRPKINLGKVEFQTKPSCETKPVQDPMWWTVLDMMEEMRPRTLAEMLPETKRLQTFLDEAVEMANAIPVSENPQDKTEAERELFLDLFPETIPEEYELTSEDKDRLQAFKRQASGEIEDS